MVSLHFNTNFSLFGLLKSLIFVLKKKKKKPKRPSVFSESSSMFSSSDLDPVISRCSEGRWSGAASNAISVNC